jgi:hypothetical protein
MTANNFRRVSKNEYKLPSGLTIEQMEEHSAKKGDEIYIQAFAAGHPRYYIDERCGKEQVIRANADGSEDLVYMDWRTGDEMLISRLVEKGKGKFSYLLSDPRFIALQKNK